jgi:multidrug efflux pump subunit AcrA (membrane-fusion protein)
MWVLVAVLVLLAGWWLRPSGRPIEEVTPLRIVKAERGEVTTRVAETGSLEPVSLVEVKSEQPGEVKRLYVIAGDRVAAGQPVAMIQQESGQARQAAQFRAQLAEEDLNLQEAERERSRLKVLFDKGFVSQKEVESAEKDYEKARVKVDLARRQLLLLLGGSKDLLDQYLKRDLGSEDLDRFVIASPLAGIVIELGVEEGEKITSGTSAMGGGTTLMKIADLSKMIVKSKINEVNIPSVGPDQPVEIRLDALPGRTYHGRVVGISPQGEKINNVVTYEVSVEIADSDGLLKPAMTANIDIITAELKDVVHIPLEAVRVMDGIETVYVVQDDQPTKRPVRVRLRTESRAVIESGIREGEEIMIQAQEKEKA